MKEQKPFE